MRADSGKQNRWARYTYPNLKKTDEEKGVIVDEDEASFRQPPTLYWTWVRIGSRPQIPTRGERNTQRLFGAVSPYDGRFAYRHQTEYFNAAT